MKPDKKPSEQGACRAGGTETGMAFTDKAQKRSHRYGNRPCKQCGFSFRKWKDEIVGTQERGFARPHP